MDADGRLQAGRRLPGAVTDSGHEFAGGAGGMQRHAAAIARDDVAGIGEAAHFDLDALERAVHVAHRAAAAGFLAEHMPWLERGAQLEVHAALGDAADRRET